MENRALMLAFEEREKTGTAKTNNKELENNGYLKIESLCSIEEFIEKAPKERGIIKYYDKNLNNFLYEPVEQQVQGCLSRYAHPKYRDLHNEIRKKVEKTIGKKLYNTYYYERFYFPGQDLKRHVDRNACEISVTLHISTNLPEKLADWPIWFKTPDTYSEGKKEILEQGKETSAILKPGDAVIYKGCERPHWRDPMPGKSKWKIPFAKTKEFYYHQIFFHYVLQDGIRCHCAFDAAR